MIDYEKLKEAISLSKGYWIKIYFFGENSFEAEINETESLDVVFVTENIDVLLEKMKELTKPKPEPKYKIGHVAWILSDEYDPLEIYIKDIDLDSDELYIDSGDNCWTEEQLYPTREALIKSQLEFWNGLLVKDITLTPEKDCNYHRKHDWETESMHPTHCKNCGAFK